MTNEEFVEKVRKRVGYHLELHRDAADYVIADKREPMNTVAIVELVAFPTLLAGWLNGISKAPE